MTHVYCIVFHLSSGINIQSLHKMLGKISPEIFVYHKQKTKFMLRTFYPGALYSSLSPELSLFFKTTDQISKVADHERTKCQLIAYYFPIKLPKTKPFCSKVVDHLVRGRCLLTALILRDITLVFLSLACLFLSETCGHLTFSAVIVFL